MLTPLTSHHSSQIFLLLMLFADIKIYRAPKRPLTSENAEHSGAFPSKRPRTSSSLLGKHNLLDLEQSLSSSASNPHSASNDDSSVDGDGESEESGSDMPSPPRKKHLQRAGDVVF